MTRLVKTRPEHEVTYQELAALLNSKAGHLDAVEFLAVAANMLGKIIALQDQRTMTRDTVMAIVASNLEAGNQQAVDQLMKS